MFKYIGIIIFHILLLGGSILAEQPYPKGDPIALSLPGDFYMAPQWSPEGSTVAATGPNFTGLYLLEFPNGNSIELSNAYSAGYEFSWSHDGSKIASRVSTFENMRRKHSLVVFNVDDATFEIISEPRSKMVGVPRWSLNDEHLYLTYAEKMESFNTLNSTSPISEPVLFIKDGRIVLSPGSGLSEMSLLDMPDRVTSYSISPDGSQIAFSSSGQNLWVAGSDGKNIVNLGTGIAPSWSPDGKWITCMVTHDDGHALLEADLFLISPEDQSRTNITNTPDQLEMHPKWSPDGNWIVFDTEGRGQLFVQQLEWK